MDTLKKIIENLKAGDKNKSLSNLAILVLIGILLVVVSTAFKSPSSQTSAAQSYTNDKSGASVSSSDYATKQYELDRENQLISILQNIKGVGRVDVKICCESGEEEVPATDVNKSVSTTIETATDGSKRNITQETDGTTVVMSNESGENSAVIVQKNNPTITGVCVVAEGAEDNYILMEIKNDVMTFFDISEDKVTVLPMKK